MFVSLNVCSMRILPLFPYISFCSNCPIPHDVIFGKETVELIRQKSVHDMPTNSLPDNNGSKQLIAMRRDEI